MIAKHWRSCQSGSIMGNRPGGQIDFDIFRNELVYSLWLAENLRPFERDARVYNDRISDSTFLLLTQSTLAKETNVANCIARMAQIPQVVVAAKESLRNPTRPILETAIRQNRGAIAYYEKGIFQLAARRGNSTH